MPSFWDIWMFIAWCLTLRMLDDFVAVAAFSVVITYIREKRFAFYGKSYKTLKQNYTQRDLHAYLCCSNAILSICLWAILKSFLSHSFRLNVINKKTKKKSSNTIFLFENCNFLISSNVCFIHQNENHFRRMQVNLCGEFSMI